jgi:hypothetical protein
LSSSLAQVIGFSRRICARDRTLAKLPDLRSDIIDPDAAVQNGRLIKRRRRPNGDGVTAPESPIYRHQN